MKLKPVLKPDVVVVEPVVELKPERRGPEKQGECHGRDNVDVPRGTVEQGECHGEDNVDVPRRPEEQGECHDEGGTDVVVIEPVVEWKPG